MVILWYYYGNIMVLLWYYHRVWLGGTTEEHRRKGGLATRNQRKKRKLRLFRVFRVHQTIFPLFFANIIFLYIFASVWGCIMRYIHNNPLRVSKIT